LDTLNDFVDGTLANPAAGPVVHPVVDGRASVRTGVVVYGNDAHQRA